MITLKCVGDGHTYSELVHFLVAKTHFFSCALDGVLSLTWVTDEHSKYTCMFTCHCVCHCVYIDTTFTLYIERMCVCHCVCIRECSSSQRRSASSSFRLLSSVNVDRGSSSSSSSLMWTGFRWTLNVQQFRQLSWLGTESGWPVCQEKLRLKV